MASLAGHAAHSRVGSQRLSRVSISRNTWREREQEEDGAGGGRKGAGVPSAGSGARQKRHLLHLCIWRHVGNPRLHTAVAFPARKAINPRGSPHRARPPRPPVSGCPAAPAAWQQQHGAPRHCRSYACNHGRWVGLQNKNEGSHSPAPASCIQHVPPCQTTRPEQPTCSTSPSAMGCPGIGMDSCTPRALTPGKTRSSASAAAAALGLPPARQSSKLKRDWRTCVEKQGVQAVGSWAAGR